MQAELERARARADSAERESAARESALRETAERECAAHQERSDAATLTAETLRRRLTELHHTNSDLQVRISAATAIWGTTNARSGRPVCAFVVVAVVVISGIACDCECCYQPPMALPLAARPAAMPLRLYYCTPHTAGLTAGTAGRGGKGTGP
jgi:hypothetical protein